VHLAGELEQVFGGPEVGGVAALRGHHRDRGRGNRRRGGSLSGHVRRSRGAARTGVRGPGRFIEGKDQPCDGAQDERDRTDDEMAT
jgi:hypothetical protein